MIQGLPDRLGCDCTYIRINPSHWLDTLAQIHDRVAQAFERQIAYRLASQVGEQILAFVFLLGIPQLHAAIVIYLRTIATLA